MQKKARDGRNDLCALCILAKLGTKGSKWFPGDGIIVPILLFSETSYES